MPWFSNGNILDFMEQNPDIDKLDVVCLMVPLRVRVLFLHLPPDKASRKRRGIHSC